MVSSTTCICERAARANQHLDACGLQPVNRLDCGIRHRMGRELVSVPSISKNTARISALAVSVVIASIVKASRRAFRRVRHAYSGYQTHESRTLHARHKDTYMAIGPFSVTFSRFKRVMVLPTSVLKGKSNDSSRSQPATPAAPNNNGPVRVNHTARQRHHHHRGRGDYRRSRVLRLPRVCQCQRVVRQKGQQRQPGQDRRGRRYQPDRSSSNRTPRRPASTSTSSTSGLHLENPALDSGELDLNEFQHLLYLANYNVSNKKDRSPSAAPPSTRSACTPPRSRTSRT